MTLIAILLGFIAVLLIGLIVAAVMRLSRARQDEQSSRSFGAAMRTAHAAMGARDPYQIPRILVTGAPAAVDALCRAWRLTSVGAPTWFGRVWHDAEGVLLPGGAWMSLPAVPILEEEFESQRVLLKIQHAQGGCDGTQMPGDNSHHLSEEIVQFGRCGKRVETTPESFVGLRQVGGMLCVI